MTTIPTPKTVTDSFPHQKLTPVATINEPPNVKTLMRLQKELDDNAGSLTAPGSTDHHGHLGLTMTVAKYTAFATDKQPYTPPNQPTAPRGAGTDQNASTLAWNKYKEAQHAFALNRACDRALVNQILEAVPEIYLAPFLDQAQNNLSKITTLELLAYLHESYGTLDMHTISENKKAMEKPWDPQFPVETLFAQLRLAQKITIDAPNPIHDTELITTGYNAIEATHVMPLSCDLWLAKATLASTFAEFTRHFSAADRNRRIAAARNPPATYAGAHRATTGTTPRTTTHPTTNTRGATPRPNTYCWSHGASQNSSHTSETCRAKMEGHQDAATLENQMGGSTKVYTDNDRRPRTARAAPAAAAATPHN